MIETSSRANRRRRWWLRIWNVGPSFSWNSQVSNVSTSVRTPDSCDDSPKTTAVHGARLMPLLRRGCAIPVGARLHLRVRGEPLQLYLPLSEPVTIIGRGPDCHIQLDDPRLPDRHSAFVWFGGILTQIRLDGRPPLVRVWRPGQRLTLGRWRTTAIWSPPSTTKVIGSSAGGAKDPGLSVNLAWNQFSRRPSSVPFGVHLVGSHPECAISLPAAGIAAVQAILLRTEHGLWLTDLAGNSLTGVNHNACKLAALDPGDIVNFGDEAAVVTVKWPAANRADSDTARPSPDQRTTDASTAVAVQDTLLTE